MSAGAVLLAAAMTAFDDLGCTVFDAPPVRGALPHAVVEEPALGDWSTKTWVGREGQLVVSVHDAGERPLRLRTLAAAVEERLAAMMPDLGERWRLVAMRLVRTRLLRGPGDRWTATVVMQVRLWRGE